MSNRLSPSEGYTGANSRHDRGGRTACKRQPLSPEADSCICIFELQEQGVRPENNVAF